MPWEVVSRDDGPCQRSLHVAAVWRDKLIIFGGYDGSNRVNDLWLYSFTQEEWSLVRGGGMPPSPRDRHVGLVWGSSFYIFGGFDGISRVNDMHEFSLGSHSWSQVRPMNGQPPSARHSHAGVVYLDSVYIFGGYDGAYRSDFHEFNFITSSWCPIIAEGRAPRARYRATCVRVETYMYLFGGHDGHRHLNDVHVFDINQRRWAELDTDGPAPTPRDSHTAIAHGRCMYVFGGSTGIAMDDFYVLRLDTANWSHVIENNNQIDTTSQDDQDIEHDTDTNASIIHPGARFCHVAVEYRAALYIFGGYDGGNRLNDFLRFPLGWWTYPGGALLDDDNDLESINNSLLGGNTLSTSIKATIKGQNEPIKNTSSLIADLRALVDSPIHSDVTFVLDDGESVYAHKVLCQRCPYFKAMFGSGESTNEGFIESTASEIAIPDTRKIIFLHILEFLYTDHCIIDLDIAMDLFQAADRFGVDRLKKICESKMLASINVENACSIFHAADRYMAKSLRDRSLSFILHHFDDVTQTPAFEDMGRSNVDLVFDVLRARSSGSYSSPGFGNRGQMSDNRKRSMPISCAVSDPRLSATGTQTGITSFVHPPPPPLFGDGDNSTPRQINHSPQQSPS